MDVHRPSITRALIPFIAIGALLTGACGGSDQSKPDNPPPASSAPVSTSASTGPKTGVKEDPGALVKAADLKAFGNVCVLSEPSRPLKGQGVESLFSCDDTTVSVLETRGAEAQAAWKSVLGIKTYTKVNDTTRLSSGTEVVVYNEAGEDSHYVSVKQVEGTKPLDDQGLLALGAEIATRIKA